MIFKPAQYIRRSKFAGWKAVNVGDGLLVGSAEGGFCGLEEYTSEQPWSINDLRDLEQQDQSTEDGKESHILRAGFEEKSAIKGTLMLVSSDLVES